MIATLDGVAEVAVLAAPDPRFGETPAAIVTARAGVADLDGATVVRHCESLLADYKVPRYVVVRQEALPRLPNGKLDKQTIRVQYRDVADRFPRLR